MVAVGNEVCNEGHISKAGDMLFDVGEEIFCVDEIPDDLEETEAIDETLESLFLTQE